MKVSLNQNVINNVYLLPRKDAFADYCSFLSYPLSHAEMSFATLEKSLYAIFGERGLRSV